MMVIVFICMVTVSCWLQVSAKFQAISLNILYNLRDHGHDGHGRRALKFYK